MIKKLLLLLSATIALALGLPTAGREKNIPIASADNEDLRIGKTFYSSYNTAYPNVGLNSGQRVGGYGWRGDTKPPGGAFYGSGYEIVYGAPSVGGYGGFVAGPVVVGGGPLVTGGGQVVTGGPVIAGGGGYGWRQGVNRWAQ